jgi:hypothetical protein
MMSSLKAIIAEIAGLFVDDGSLALSIVIWVGIVSLALPRLEIVRPWSGVILFVGLSVILVGSALRGTRR